MSIVLNSPFKHVFAALKFTIFTLLSLLVKLMKCLAYCEHHATICRMTFYHWLQTMDSNIVLAKLCHTTCDVT